MIKSSVVPTILALMDLPVPQAVDGRILFDACRTSFSVVYTADEITTSTNMRFSNHEAQEIMQRLQNLGYL